MYKAKDFPRRTLRVNCEGDSDEEFAKAGAALFINPAFSATRIICAIEDSRGLAAVLDIPSLQTAITDAARAGPDGDRERLRTSLVSHSIALQSLFVRLIEQGHRTSRAELSQGWVKLALKAQAQCVEALEMLCHVQRGTVVYSHQTNIAATQQVNNFGPEEKKRNELSSGAVNVLPKNPETSSLNGGLSPVLAALGEVYRSQDCRRERAQLTERF